MRIVFVGGVYDLFHYGHLEHLKRAKGCGDVLIVGLLTDKAAAKWKRKPFIPYKQRKAILEVIRYVDMVVPMEDVNGTKLVEILKPDIIVKGDDAKSFEEDWVKENKKRILYVPYVKEQSTTKIINNIKKQWKKKISINF